MPPDILMIEDEPNIAEALRFILTRDGWQVQLHPDGIGGIEKIRDARPRLIILDLMLPNRSGAEILADLRGDDDPQLASTPVLMLTARGQGADSAQQADVVLAKPFANDELRATVRQFLD
ncbi:response regulator transcription factor [Paracoccus seriniphilus]|uniref:Response regulator receiver domain-containing protein n=1 Tax=Paracoccus seriniphilus TaxID=184748 RepID=A0A239PVR0_9RHOB|nr:response regulator [Paracoccus seriniphilus]WCR13374.1 response regulator transcription factor [Paracoccus seriniphilus]SNT74381.1 Response regulator receiver domain-containing protein [Paracoccus seriniphilus]